MADLSPVDGVTALLARFVHEASFDSLPASALHAARRALVNIVGCCIGGARHPIVDAAARTLLPLGGAPDASLFGRAERSDILSAALLNALSSAAYSFDDTHAETILHPTGPVAAALFALAERRPLRGDDFVLALALGIDVASRVSKAVSVAPADGDIGWSQTGIAAGTGAAAAASKALGLDPQGITWAIGIAALQACGFRAAHGTMSATLIFGHAAHGGLRAALLAQGGLGAPISPLEGKYGFASLFANRPHLPHLTDELGSRFEVEALGYKPYPCGIVIHPAVDAALEWHHSHAADAGSIAQVRLQAHPSALALGFRRHPASELEAKVSACHWIAAALVRGRAGLAEGRQSAIDDAEIVRLRGLVEMHGDEGLTAEAAQLTVQLASGAAHTVAIDACKGSVANPMSDEDLSDKFLGQAQLQLQQQHAARLLEHCWQVDALPDAGDLARASAIP